MDFLADTDISVNVEFYRNGQLAVPDSGSVRYTIYDHDGIPMSGRVDVPVSLSATATRVAVPLTAAETAITGRFGKRIITVAYTVAGEPYQMQRRIRLVPMLNHSVEPRAVRSFLGVSEDELRDDDIDLVRAYFDAETAIGRTTLEAALKAGDETELAANDVILYRAVLDVIPSLKQRITQSQSDGPLTYARPTVNNFDALTRIASDRLGEATQTVSGGGQLTFTLMVLTNGVDPITGA